MMPLYMLKKNIYIYVCKMINASKPSLESSPVQCFNFDISLQDKLRKPGHFGGFYENRRFFHPSKRSLQNSSVRKNTNFDVCVPSYLKALSSEGSFPEKGADSTQPTCMPYPLSSCPPRSHPPLPRFPCTRCPRERSRAIVIQYCQTWRRIYNPSGFLVSLLPGVTGLLGMDASSSLSNHPSKGTRLEFFPLSSSYKVAA